MNDRFTSDHNVTISGIELARTSEFKQIIASSNDNALEHPVFSAVNDAHRYHSVRSLVG